MAFPSLHLVPNDCVPLSDNATQHLRNVLMLIRVALDCGELLMANEPSLVVPVEMFGAMQARIEKALELIELDRGSL